MTSAEALATPTTARPRDDAAAQLRQAAILLGLVALTVIVRWPFHDVVGEDESFFLVVARQWTHGVAPYIGAYDVKPPGLFAVVALAESVLGAGIDTIKLLEIAAVATMAVVIYLFGRRHLTQGVGLIGAGLYIVASLDLSGVNSAAELIASALVSLGMLAGWNAVRANERSSAGCAAAGLLIGAALTVKQPAVFEAAALLLMTWLAAPRAHRWRLATIEAVAMGVAPLAFAGFYALTGHFGDLLTDAVFGAAGRMKGDNLGWGDALARVLPMLKPVLPLLAFALLAWAQRRRLRDYDATLLMLWVWLAGALLGILAVKAMYDHYYLTLLPPLALLSGVFLDRLPIGPDGSAWRTAARIGLPLATAGYLLAGLLPFLAPAPGEIAAEQQIAAQMRSLGQQPDDRILVLNRHLAIYLYAGAEPSAAVFHPLQLLCPFPQLDGKDAVAVGFAGKPAFVVLSDPAVRMICELSARRREAAALLASDYCPVGRSAVFVSAGATDRMTLYARRDRAGVACRPDIPPPDLGS